MNNGLATIDDTPESAARPKPHRYLVVSPYHEQDHLLNLDSIDMENQLLALSLTKLECLREDYATAAYAESFNWAEVIETLRMLTQESGHSWKETSFFVVAFRSRIPPTTIYADLGKLDKAAHAEATESGGFLKCGFPPVSLAEQTELTLVADTGSGPLTPRAATWRRASGDQRRTQRKEGLALPIAKQQVLLDLCIPFGK